MRKSLIIVIVALFAAGCEKKIVKPKPPIDNKTLKDKKVMQLRGE